MDDEVKKLEKIVQTSTHKLSGHMFQVLPNHLIKKDTIWILKTEKIDSYKKKVRNFYYRSASFLSS